MVNIAVLVSGSGTNLQAIIDACEKNEINGKVKATIKIPVDSAEEFVKEQAHAAVADLIEGKNVVKEIYVKNKIYNIVIK